jgi:hypothetical protein
VRGESRRRRVGKGEWESEALRLWLMQRARRRMVGLRRAGAKCGKRRGFLLNRVGGAWWLGRGVLRNGNVAVVAM